MACACGRVAATGPRGLASRPARHGPGGPSGLQNWQGVAIPRLEGSIPSPRRGWKWGSFADLCDVFCSANSCTVSQICRKYRLECRPHAERFGIRCAGRAPARTGLVGEVPAALRAPGSEADRAGVDSPGATGGGVFHEAHSGGLAAGGSRRGAPGDAADDGCDRSDVVSGRRRMAALLRARAGREAVDAAGVSACRRSACAFDRRCADRRRDAPDARALEGVPNGLESHRRTSTW